MKIRLGTGRIGAGHDPDGLPAPGGGRRGMVALARAAALAVADSVRAARQLETAPGLHETSGQ